MNFETARNKLSNHANLTFDLVNPPDEESLLFVLFNANKLKIAPTELLSIRQEIIECLEIINIKWNGAIPSNTSDGDKEIERYLVNALSQIIHSCWEYFREWQENRLFEQEVLHQLSFTTWSISCAWNAVLAGDIDSIAQEVEFERMTRQVF